jgi:hypothetical protein
MGLTASRHLRTEAAVKKIITTTIQPLTRPTAKKLLVLNVSVRKDEIQNQPQLFLIVNLN